VLSVPAGYRGVVVGEKDRPFSEDEPRHFKVSGQFNELTMWNLDQKTSKNDRLCKAMMWTNIAEAIHT
jgi:hypothetical protein